MLEKSSGTHAGIFAILILIVPILITSYPAFATSHTGVIIPLYSNPDSYWNQVIHAKDAHPSVPIVAIINPHNGPTNSLSNYVTGIHQLQSAGIIVLGYVYTNYGTRSTSEVESEMNSYSNWYHVNGILFDEMANTPGFETYYSNFTSYVKSHGMTFTVGNPGIDTLPSYVGTVDNICIYEDVGLPVLATLGGWHANYAKSNWSMIAIGSSLPSQKYLDNVSQHVSYVYFTDSNMSDPYKTVPSYLDTLVGILDNSSTTVPQPPTGLTTTAFSSHINLGWTTPANNGGSPITGYKIERAASGGAFSVIVANTSSTATTFSDTGLQSSTTYTYRVSAINVIGTSSPSNTASATTSASITVPSQPTGLTAKAVSPSQINLSWTAPTSNGGSVITGYKIGRSTDGGSTWTAIVSNTGSTSTTYSDTGLASNTSYTYRVSAINSVGTSSRSNTAAATTAAIPSPLIVDNGYTGVFDSNTQPNSLTPFGSLFTGLAAGTKFGIMTIDVGANCGGDNLEGALYDSNGNLLSSSNSISCITGKMNVTLNNAVTVPANGKLWAMVMSSGGNAQFNTKATGANTSYLGTSQGSLFFPNTIPSLAADYTYSPHIILYLHNK